eukprot:m.303615 g.303615  ORF g.303615 m.303615 type:complete len:404 (+) comp40836_c0_seq2:158-1369(+)
MAASSALTTRPPALLNLADPAHKGENWKNFERQWKYFSVAAKIDDEPGKVQTAFLLNTIGDDGLDLYETFTWDEEDDAKDIAKVLKKYRDYCVPVLDETFERYTFYQRDQAPGEPMSEYITAVTKLARTCNFGIAKDTHIRDRLVQGIRDGSLRQKLFEKQPLTMEKCLAILRANEVNKYRAQAITTAETVQHVRSKPKPKPKPNTGRSTTDQQRHQPNRSTQKPGKLHYGGEKCSYCGLAHASQKSSCSAVERECRKCGKKGHYERVCKSKAVHQVDTDRESGIQYVELNSINAPKGTPAKATFRVRGTQHDITFQIDTGAMCNVLSYVDNVAATGDRKGSDLEATNKILVMHNKTHVKPRGVAQLHIERNGHVYAANFIIVPDKATPLLSLRASQGIGEDH